MRRLELFEERSYNWFFIDTRNRNLVVLARTAYEIIDDTEMSCLSSRLAYKS